MELGKLAGKCLGVRACRMGRMLGMLLMLTLLTVSLGVAVPTILAAPRMPPLTPPTQATVLVEKGSTRNDEWAIEWTQTYGELYSEEGICVEQTADGGYLITGSTESYGDINGDVWLIKTDADGIVEWTQTYGGPEEDWGYWVKQTADGGYLITGSTESYGAGDFDVWLIKTDADGAVEWNQTYGGPEYDWGTCVETTADGGYLITGLTHSFGAGLWDVWLIKTDTTGHVEWTQTYGGHEPDGGDWVEQTTDGGYLIIGGTHSYGAGVSDVWLIKTDATGHVEWNQTYGGPVNDWGVDGEQTADGGYLITGYTYSYANRFDVWLIKTDALGNAEWNQTYGGSELDDLGLDGEQTADGGYLLVGTTMSYGAGGNDVWLIKTDALGTVVWNQTYGGPKEDWGYSVKQTADGGYLIAGYTESYGAGEKDVWLIKVSGAGAVTSPVVSKTETVTSPVVSETETVTSPVVSEVPWRPVFWALAVLGIVIVGGGVFAKRKR